MYLEGIFGGGDISKQLPEQARFFDRIDKSFKKVHFIQLVKTSIYWNVADRSVFE